MIRLYDCMDSGNGYKVRLLLTLLGLDFERVELNVMDGETHSAEYCAKNANYRIPVLEFPDGRRLAESNAILFYLAEASTYLPDDHWQRAQILQWQFFEQYSHEPNIAVMRFWHLANRLQENETQIAVKIQGGNHALAVMEGHLASKPFFVANRYTIADISLFAYTHVCHEGGFDLSPFPAVRAWLDRVKNEDGHIAITEVVGRQIAWSQVCAETGNQAG